MNPHNNQPCLMPGNCAVKPGTYCDNWVARRDDEGAPFLAEHEHKFPIFREGPEVCVVPGCHVERQFRGSGWLSWHGDLHVDNGCKCPCWDFVNLMSSGGYDVTYADVMGNPPNVTDTLNLERLAAALDVLSDDDVEYELAAPEEREDRKDAAERLAAEYARLARQSSERGA